MLPSPMPKPSSTNCGRLLPAVYDLKLFNSVVLWELSGVYEGILLTMGVCLRPCLEWYLVSGFTSPLEVVWRYYVDTPDPVCCSRWKMDWNVCQFIPWLLKCLSVLALFGTRA